MEEEITGLRLKELGHILCDSDTGDIISKTEDLDKKIVEHRDFDIKVVGINSFDRKNDRITFFSVVD